jgi:hypothetical protein
MLELRISLVMLVNAFAFDLLHHSFSVSISIPDRVSLLGSCRADGQLASYDSAQVHMHRRTRTSEIICCEARWAMTELRDDSNP